MARLEYQEEATRDPEMIQRILAEGGYAYERWGVRENSRAAPEAVLAAYDDEINRLKQQRGYKTADVIALDPETPGLEAICAKFRDEHHHSEDEVRFVVDGEGVFELDLGARPFAKFLAEPGDLIVVPAKRRHLFYLTESRSIRCIRLFKTTEGWEAIYQPEDGSAPQDDAGGAQ